MSEGLIAKKKTNYFQALQRENEETARLFPVVFLGMRNFLQLPFPREATAFYFFLQEVETYGLRSIYCCPVLGCPGMFEIPVAYRAGRKKPGCFKAATVGWKQTNPDRLSGYRETYSVSLYF